MTEQIDWLAKQRLQVACVLEDLKCWGAGDTTCGHKAKDITPWITWRREAWKEEASTRRLAWKDERHYLQAQSQGHHTIMDRLEKRGVERGSTRRLAWKDERWPSSVRRTEELFQRQCCGHFWETGWSTDWLFRAQRYHLGLHGTKSHCYNC